MKTASALEMSNFRNEQMRIKEKMDKEVESVTEKEKIRSLNLRTAGASFRDIAIVMGFTGEYVARRITEAAALEYNDEMHTARLSQRMITNMRYDAMLMSIWPEVLKGSPSAIAIALKIESDRRALNGLDATPPPTTNPYNYNQAEAHRLAASIEIIKGAFNDPSVVESTGRILESLVSAPSGTRIPSE